MRLPVVICLTAFVLQGCMETGGASTSAPRIPSGAERLSLAVGQTAHLDAYRADSCGGAAPSWASVQARLPASSIVTYSDGGISSRDSRSCGTSVATRAVNATGIAAGTEVHTYSDTIAVTVQ